MATTVRLLQNYTLSGVPYKAGELVSIDSTLATQLSTAKVTDSAAAAITQATTEGKVIKYPDVDALTYQKNASKKEDIDSYLTVAEIPSSPGTYRVGTQLYVGDGVNTINLRKHVLVNKCISPRIKTTDLPTITTTVGSVFTVVGPTFLFNSYRNGTDFYASNSQVTPLRGKFLFTAGTGAFGFTTSTGVGGNYSGSGGFSFIHTGTTFEFALVQSGGSYLIKVDGEYITSFTATSVGSTGGAVTYVKGVFATYAKRRIEVIGTNLVYVGIAVAHSDAIEPTSPPKSKMIVLGDSWSQNGPQSWGTWFGEALGIEDTWSSGIGGTGLAATPGNGEPTYGTRLQTDVIDQNPDIVVIQGSGNDPTTGTTTVDALKLLITRLRAALPTAALIYTVPIGSPPQGRNVTNRVSFTGTISGANLTVSTTPVFLDAWNIGIPIINVGSTILVVSGTMTALATVLTAPVGNQTGAYTLSASPGNVTGVSIYAANPRNYIQTPALTAMRLACKTAALENGLVVVDAAAIQPAQSYPAMAATIIRAVPAGYPLISTSCLFNAGEVLSINNGQEIVEVINGQPLTANNYTITLTSPLQSAVAVGMPITVSPRHLFSGDGYVGREKWVTATLINATANVTVPDASIFIPRQCIYVDTTIGGLTARQPYFISSIINATTVTLSASYNDFSGNFGANITFSAGGTTGFGQVSNSDVFLDSTLHPSQLGAMHIGQAAAEQVLSNLL